MKVHAGDKVRMTDLRTGETIHVVVIHVQGDKVTVEDAHGPRPRRTWLVGAAFLSPLMEEQEEREPSDDEIYNRHGVEGGIAYDTHDEPGSLGEHDWRL